MKPKSGKLMPRSFSAESALAEADSGLGVLLSAAGCAGFELHPANNAITASSMKATNTANCLRISKLTAGALQPECSLLLFQRRFIHSLLARLNNCVDPELGEAIRNFCWKGTARAVPFKPSFF